jgi:hypothetical protein
MSLKRFELRSTLAQCPIYWQNFIVFLQRQLALIDRDVSVPVLQRELRQYGGRYHMAGSERWDYIEFDTADQFAWFVLRWS